jgi:branched-chain amino acid transport system substrate-binding protein
MAPNAMAIAPLIQEAKVPTLIFVATGLEITKKSDYFIRTGHTTAQVGTPLARQVRDGSWQGSFWMWAV